MKMTTNLFRQKAVNTFLVLAGLIIIFALFSPRHVFLHPRNIAALGKLFPDLGIVALGVGMLMICGEFDLSIGSVLPFCAYIFARSLYAGFTPLAGFVFALLTGAAMGWLNGFITVKTRMPSFITTLGTLMFWRGVLYVWSKMMPLGIRQYVPSKSSFGKILTASLPGRLPIQSLWFSLFAIILGILLHYHRFGNWVYATGDNKDAARAMGINTNMVKVICFIIVGVLCGFVACAQISRLACFTSRTGDGWELKAVAACVIGGTSLRGGIGSMTGIFLGAVIISVIENGLVVLQIPYFWTYVVFGLVILFSVLSSMYVERKLMETHQ